MRIALIRIHIYAHSYICSHPGILCNIQPHTNTHTPSATNIPVIMIFLRKLLPTFHSIQRQRCLKAGTCHVSESKKESE